MTGISLELTEQMFTPIPLSDAEIDAITALRTGEATIQPKKASTPYRPPAAAPAPKIE